MPVDEQQIHPAAQRLDPVQVPDAPKQRLSTHARRD
jgi:hypothetical protein